jgi:hypothetical protein
MSQHSALDAGWIATGCSGDRPRLFESSKPCHQRLTSDYGDSCAGDFVAATVLTMDFPYIPGREDFNGVSSVAHETDHRALPKTFANHGKSARLARTDPVDE